MKSSEVEAFEHFWRHVELAKEQINIHSTHLEFGSKKVVELVMPGHLDVHKDVEFETAYRKIKPYLRHKQRMYTGPHGSHYRSCFNAENSHQALMLLLNPWRHAIEVPRYLGSSQFLQIEKEAKDELEHRKYVKENPSRRGMGISTQLRTKTEDRILISLITKHHYREGKLIEEKPLEQHAILDRLRRQGIMDWPQCKVSRVMKRIFGKSGQVAYRKMLRSGDSFKKGFLKVLVDGGHVPEAIDDSDEE